MRVLGIERDARSNNNKRNEIENMHAVIQHAINDQAKWEQAGQRIMSMIEQQRLPKGIKALEYLPSVDGCKAVCVWEADSMNTLKDFMERETSGAARNDYFELKAENAFGLPTGQQSTLSRAA